MSLAVIQSNAESDLLTLIIRLQADKDEKLEKNYKFLLCRFFHAGLVPDANEIKKLLDFYVSEGQINIYFCGDGDVVLCWQSDKNDTSLLSGALWKKYSDHITTVMSENEFFEPYSYFDALDLLKSECIKKQKIETTQSLKLNEYMSNDGVIYNFKKIISLISTQKFFRGKPHILIVEDQIFSQKMMTTILKDYTCYVASTCSEAVLIYMEKYPDIVFLDIDLPDLSGHSFAELLMKVDDSAYVVMVSANHYQDDVNKAMKNKVKGFITKPYKKDKILSIVEKYSAMRKKKK